MSVSGKSPLNCRLPLSTSMPAYSKLNQRRRITCRTCDLPLGYVPLYAAYLEAELAKLYKMTDERRSNRCSQQLSRPSSLKERFLSMSLSSNVHNAERVDIRQKLFKRITISSTPTQDRMDENIDNRMFLPIFLPDAINVHVSRRCNSAGFKADADDPCGIPHHFKFLGDIIQSADNVYCTGCDTCLGVRFQPTTSDQKLLIVGWRSSRGARSLTRSSFVTHTTADEESEYVDHELPRVNSIAHGHTLSMNTIEDEGWITLSLERVMIEPLFGLVGLEQFSIRYEGGEMMPQFYRSIESCSLLSQNSATWMWPIRRSKDRRVPNTERGTLQFQSWGKTYYDLERAEKAVPNTLGHGDLVAATIRRLAPIYPTEDESTKEKSPDAAERINKTI